MTITEAVELINKYAECPKCGEYMSGSVEFDANKGYFKRTYECGWSVEVRA